MSNFQHFIELLETKELSDYQDSYQAFSLIADGQVNNEEIKEFLTLINQNGINEVLLFGAAKALNERSIKLKAPQGTIDVCGTGGDNSNSLNISTSVAIIVASMGITVAKHGNKAVSSKSGSADILTELGINLNQSQRQVEDSLAQNNLAFIFAPLYHPALKNVAAVRLELGVRTIFNFLGPVLNPAQTKLQLIGCSDQNIAKIILKVCALLGKEKCFTVTGFDGMDEISISSNTVINKMENGNFSQEIFDPEKYGFKKYDIKLIEGKDASYNAAQLIKLLKNEIDNEQMQAYKDIVTLNCAAALIVGGLFIDFDKATLAVKKQIESKESYSFFKKFINNQ